MPHLPLPSRGRCIRFVAATVLAALLAACGGSSSDNDSRPAAGATSTIGAAAPGVFGQSAAPAPAAVCGTADLSGAGSFVYVSTSGSDVRGCGSTTAKACKTIQYGIDSCAAEGCAVLVRHGLYPTGATIALKNAVSVYGSCRFDGEVDRRYRTTIQASPAPGTPAVIADGIEAATAFSGIVVIAKDETANGTASIGMVVNNSKGLSLSQNTLVGGRGGNGATGALVAATPGNTGSDATVTIGNATWSGAGGTGAPACVYAGRSDGAGGVGANQNTVYSSGCFISCGCQNTGGTNGGNGRPGGNNVVGGGGGGVGPNGPICSPGSNPTNGGTGGTGTPGVCSQAPGVADANPWGEFKAAAWQPGSGGGGNLGDWGAGGGGGGAGSVCTHTNFTQADFFGYPGGGGGSGGCGGPGGTGGQQGGASIALVLASSSVTVDPGALAIVPGQGGTGGQGGPGSTGGAGGKGGKDGSASYFPNLANCTVGVDGGNEGGLGYPGGPGGVGGQGGGGSGAAGGNGGPSIGIGLSGNAAAPSSVTGIYLGLPGGGGAQGPGGAGARCTGVAGSVGAGGGTGPLINLDKPAPSVLTSGQALVQGQSRTSANGAYTLLLQTDGNLCLKTLPALNYVWCSLQNKLGSADRVAMQTDGNLCLSTGGNTTNCTGTAPHPGAYLTVRDDGRAAIYEGSTVLWSVP